MNCREANMSFKTANGAVSSSEDDSPQTSSPAHSKDDECDDDEMQPQLTAMQNHHQAETPSRSDSTLSISARSAFNSVSGESLPGPDEVDALVAQEMNRMSQGERERAYQDLHCVIGSKTIPGESPDVISEAMEEVRDIIKKMDPATKEACAVAQRQDPRLLHEPRFVLRFLRAANYEPMDCAKRLVAYFELKKALFGTQKLCKHVSLEDLDQDDIRCLESGIMQVLPARDRAGRAVLFWNMCLRGTHSVMSRRRGQFYGLQAGSESEAVQQRGMIIVSWNHGDGKMPAPEMEAAYRNPAMVAMNQIRCEAFHFCIDKEDDRVISSALKKLVGAHTRVRFRTHYGSVQEICGSLRTFGIPTTHLPISEEGNFLFHNHTAWLQKRREIEASVARRFEGASALLRFGELEKHNSVTVKMKVAVAPERNSTPTNIPVSKKPKLIEEREQSQPKAKNKPSRSRDKEGLPKKEGQNEPSDKDVVMGKGKFIQEMPGNVRLRDMIKVLFVKYESLKTAQEKTFMAMDVVQTVKEGGGKFLKEDESAPGSYIEVDAVVARDKVASAFHSHRRFNKKKMEHLPKTPTLPTAAAKDEKTPDHAESAGPTPRAAVSNPSSQSMPQVNPALAALAMSRAQYLLGSNTLSTIGFGSQPFGFWPPEASVLGANVTFLAQGARHGLSLPQGVLGCSSLLYPPFFPAAAIPASITRVHAVAASANEQTATDTPAASYGGNSLRRRASDDGLPPTY